MAETKADVWTSRRGGFEVEGRGGFRADLEGRGTCGIGVDLGFERGREGDRWRILRRFADGGAASSPSQSFRARSARRRVFREASPAVVGAISPPNPSRAR